MRTEPPVRGARAHLEGALWLTLVALNLVSHFAMLGQRAMGHDEGIHAYYSYTLGRSFDYEHDPAYHGPLLYHSNALVYALIGDSDATARALPAIAGVALVAVLYFARGALGRRGAFFAALIVSLSPVLLFYGRYLRNDIYVALFYLVWSLAAFRYLRGGDRRWLWGVTIPMALAFSAKEVTFIFGATIGAYFLVLGLADAWRRRTAEGRRALDLATWMLTLALPFAAPLLGLPFGIDPDAYESGPIAGRLASIAAAVGLAMALALARFRVRRAAGDAEQPTLGLWGGHFAAFWVFLIALFTTLFTNFPGGIYSGVLGSLGYWLSQQEVARGSQPVYYYPMLALLYETLALVLFVAGGLALARHWRSPRSAANPLQGRHAFPCFCFWWGGASWIGYSAGGERMPWLLVHIALPMALLGGWAAAQLAGGLRRWRPYPPGALVALGGLAPVFALLAAEALSSPILSPAGALTGPPADSGRAASAAPVLISRSLLAVGWLIWAWRARRGVARDSARRIVAAGALAGLALWSLRASLHASFVHYDLAVEPLVYAHGTPDVKRALAEIEELVARAGSSAGAETGLDVTFDNEVTWPMLWYLRHQPGSRFAPEPRQLTATVPVALVGPAHFQEAEAILGRTHARRDYRLTWWPHEGYREMTPASLARILASPAELRWLYGVVVHREYAGIPLDRWTHRSEFRLYVDRELAAQVWPLGLEALERLAFERHGATAVRGGGAIACEAEAVFSAPYAGLALAGPAAVAALPEGGVAVADVGNHRIVMIAPDGALVRTLGGPCELARGAEGGCVDPDGPEGTMPLGAGQFWQPWGVAVSARGETAVADTWNGRIQLFDREGRFLWSWGRSALGPSVGDPSTLLYGPRAVAFDPTGDRILVADTGHARLIELSLSGERLGEIAAPGSGLGAFAEPIGVAYRASDGDLLVADTWNRRLLARDGGQGRWSVAAELGTPRPSLATTPYLAIDQDGMILVSDPDHGRLLRVATEDSKGSTALVGRSGELSLHDPVGVATTADRRVWVSSRSGNAIWRLPPAGDCRAVSDAAP